jgi:hypothetical protein
MTKFDVISPDGIPIHYENTYESKESAMDAFNDWKKRYEFQGYYSSNNGRIPLDELHNHIQIIQIQNL